MDPAAATPRSGATRDRKSAFLVDDATRAVDNGASLAEMNRPRLPSGRKLLVASLGVAAVNFAAACHEPPPTAGNSPGPNAPSTAGNPADPGAPSTRADPGVATQPALPSTAASAPPPTAGNLMPAPPRGPFHGDGG
jgi:hypothetical protein